MPPADLARYAVSGAFCLVLAAAAASDLRSRRIPNWAILALLLLFATRIATGGGPPLLSSLAAAGIALAVTGGLYLAKVIGAGDSKLFTAVALFLGLSDLGAFALVTTLAGGVIAVANLIFNRKKVLRGMTAAGRAEGRHGLPYGLPIAISGILILSLSWLPPAAPAASREKIAHEFGVQAAH